MSAAAVSIPGGEAPAHSKQQQEFSGGVLEVPMPPSASQPPSPGSLAEEEFKFRSGGFVLPEDEEDSLRPLPLSHTLSSLNSLLDMQPLDPEVKRAVQQRELLHIKDGRRHLLLGMVGLPGRGKSYTSQKLCRYLTWLGYKTRVFNLGQYRRERIRADLPCSWFDPDNAEGMSLRAELLDACLADIGRFWAEGGQAAILDGTNSTVARRHKVRGWLRASRFAGELMWIECVATDPELIECNVRATWQASPDYAGASREEAMEDFRRRIAVYEDAYQPVGDAEVAEDTSYVRLVNNGQKAETNGIRGYLPGRIVFYLMNLQNTRRPIYFSRHGQSEWNVTGRLGGNSPLTARGAQYAGNLGRWLRRELQGCPGCRAEAAQNAPQAAEEQAQGAADGSKPSSPSSCSGGCSSGSATTAEQDGHLASPPSGSPAAHTCNDIPQAPAQGVRVWCSTLDRTIQTAGRARVELGDLALGEITRWRALAEINAGIYDGCTYEQVQEMDPDGFEARSRDKLNYKYPQGESYKDVIDRVERVIFELERQEQPVLVVAHQAVIRCLYGYFADVDLKDIPILPIPLHTVIKLTPAAYRCAEERICLDGGCGKVEANSEDDHQPSGPAPSSLNSNSSSSGAGPISPPVHAAVGGGDVGEAHLILPAELSPLAASPSPADAAAAVPQRRP